MLHQAVSDYLTKHIEDDFKGLKARKHIENREGHGREEAVAYDQAELPEDLPGQSDWKGLQTIGFVVSYREQKDKWSTEVPLLPQFVGARCEGLRDLRSRSLGNRKKAAVVGQLRGASRGKT